MRWNPQATKGDGVREGSRLSETVPYLLIVLLAGLVVLACLSGGRARASDLGSPVASPSPVVTPPAPPPERTIVVGGGWWRWCRARHADACRERRRLLSLALVKPVAVPAQPRNLHWRDWVTFGNRCKRLAKRFHRRYDRLLARGGDPVGLGRQLAAARGWTGAQWAALYELWRRESGWRPLAHNPYSGAHGIPQALPGSKMAAFGADWYSNPRTQILWGLAYVRARYGCPSAALGHLNAYGWY